MSHAAESREVLLELNTGLAARRRALPQHLQNRPLLLRAIFRPVLYLQVELDLWRAHWCPGSLDSEWFRRSACSLFVWCVPSVECFCQVLTRWMRKVAHQKETK